MYAFDDVFERYVQNYAKIFRIFYPSKNSTGFTEQNLTVNFSKAYESVHPSAVTWFEYQFGPENDLHYDALILDPETKEIFLIEAKRFSAPLKKLGEVRNDVERINQAPKKYRADFDRIPEFDRYSLRGVILADVWTETRQKQELLLSFTDGSFAERYQISGLTDPEYHISDFSLSGNYEAIREKYRLLSLIWAIQTV